MASWRLAIIVLICAVVAAQSQRRQFPSRGRVGTGPSSTSLTSQTSSRGRSSFGRAGSSLTSSGGSGSSFSQLSASAGGAASGRTSSSRASSTRTTSSFRRPGSQGTSPSGSPLSRASSTTGGRSSFGRQQVSTSTSGSRSSFGSSRRQPQTARGRKSSSRTSGGSAARSPARSSSFGRGTSGSSRGSSALSRKSSTSSRGSSAFNRKTSASSRGSSAFNRKTSASSRGSSAFNRKNSASSRSSSGSSSGSSGFPRSSSSSGRRTSSFPSSNSRNRAQTRSQTGGNRGRVLGGSRKNTVLKQSPAVNFNCPAPDGFFEDSSQCDKYFSCKEGVAKAHTCPDGLLFHPNRTYPCVYPVEANCEGRSAQQRAQPTEGCPRQFATFKAAEDESCGAFTRCINGRPYPSNCSEGLAFDARTLGCEYADEVDGCDAPAYLGFQCPQREFTEAEVGEFTREPHPDDCTKFYVCVNKEDGSVQPRLQGCPQPSVFDANKAECNSNPEDVPGCEDAIPAAVVASFRQRDSDEQERRADRLAELRKKLQG